jgi:hypothetical protein
MMTTQANATFDGRLLKAVVRKMSKLMTIMTFLLIYVELALVEVTRRPLE